MRNKKYAEDQFISAQWNNFRIALQSAFILTIFGYAAPTSDEEAISTMREAWKGGKERQIEQIELINIAPRAELLRSWDAFFTRDHYDVRTSFYDSWCTRHPRRSCEACWDQFMEVHVRENNAIPRDLDFAELEDWFRPLLHAERLVKPRDPARSEGGKVTDRA